MPRGHCGNSGTENSVKLIVALGTMVACEDEDAP